MKAKFFREDNTFDLEKTVNNFIKGKNIINISYSVAKCGYGYIHCCCILYKED